LVSRRFDEFVWRSPSPDKHGVQFGWEILAELNAGRDRPADTQLTEAQINAMGEAARQPLTKPARKPRKPVRTVRLSAPATADSPFSIIPIKQHHPHQGRQQAGRGAARRRGA
jgi:hypothetical protein